MPSFGHNFCMVVYANSLKYRAEAMKTFAIIQVTPFGLILLAIILEERDLNYLMRMESIIAFCVMLIGRLTLQRGNQIMLELDMRKEYGINQDFDQPGNSKPR